jgi:hypothetical protein
MLERKFVAHDWAMRVNLSLIGICIVDAWLLHAGARGEARRRKQYQFYEQLALDLVDNNFDIVGLRRRFDFDDTPNVLASTAGVGPHATPTKISKKKRTGEQVSYRVQRDCRVCKRHRTTRVCSECRNVGRPDYFVSDSSKGRACFARHYTDVHNKGC